MFGSDRFGFAYNTEALEQLLKQEFGTSMKLGDIDFPKYANNNAYYNTLL